LDRVSERSLVKFAQVKKFTKKNRILAAAPGLVSTRDLLPLAGLTRGRNRRLLYRVRGPGEPIMLHRRGHQRRLQRLSQHRKRDTDWLRPGSLAARQCHRQHQIIVRAGPGAERPPPAIRDCGPKILQFATSAGVSGKSFWICSRLSCRRLCTRLIRVRVTSGKSRVQESRLPGSVRVAPCKRMEFRRL
jgi:hypothetical protein